MSETSAAAAADQQKKEAVEIKYATIESKAGAKMRVIAKQPISKKIAKKTQKQIKKSKDKKPSKYPMFKTYDDAYEHGKKNFGGSKYICVKPCGDGFKAYKRLTLFEKDQATKKQTKTAKKSEK